MTVMRPTKDGFVSILIRSRELSSWIRYGTYWLHRQEKEADLQLPNQCPQCGVAYRVNEERKLTPLKPHRTGLQKVNQVLADSLIRSMKNAHENNTKVVLFSDSRQSAAKLSAGIELDHYRDAVRWLMLKALKGDSEVINFLKKFQFGNISSREDSDMLTRLYNKGTYIELIDLIRTKDKGWLNLKKKLASIRYMHLSKMSTWRILPLMYLRVY